CARGMVGATQAMPYFDSW
nr:immunoglobulin heavy chain junction region [Macaca mulatta]